MATANIKAVITAEDRASGVISKVGSNFSTMAGAFTVGGLAVNAVTAAFNGVVDAGKNVLKGATDFEQSRVAFETMLGSADKAKKMLKEVSDFAAKTPFELPEVVTGAKQLLAYNIEADKIIPTFKALGNIAAGVGKDKLPQLILAFGQVKAATKLTGQELRQFTEAGVPLLSTLATQMGKTEEEIKKMVETGKIGFPDVEKALFGMSQEGGKFAGLMEKQSLTLGGVMSNLSDNFGRIGREIVGISDTGDIKEGGIFYYLTKGANGFLQWVDTNKDKIIGFFQGIVDFTKSAVQFIKPRMEDLFSGVAPALTKAWEFLKPSLEALWKTIEEKVYPVFQRLWKEVLEPLMPVLGVLFVGAIWLVINALNILLQIWSFFENILISVVSFFTTTVPEAFQKATNWIVEKVTYLKDHFWESIGFIIGFFATLPAKILFWIVAAIGGVIDWLSKIDWGKILNNILDAFKSLGSNIWNAMVDTWNKLKNINWGEVASGIGKGIANAIVGMVEGAINGAIAGTGLGKVKLPRFARGVENFSGGLAIVGERGPEIVNLPKGSSVIPNNKIAPVSGGNTTINISPQIGVFAGSPQEMRNLSVKILDALKDIADSKNMTVGEMLA